MTLSRLLLAASWLMVAAIAVAAAVVAIRGQWFAAAQLSIFVVASLIILRGEWGLPPFLDFAFVAVAVGNAAGWVWNLFNTVFFFDEAAHFLTTFTFALSFGYMTYASVREHFKSHPVHFLFAIATFGISLGVAWEVAEWLFIEELKDPVSDLIFDSAGAVLAGAAGAWWLTISGRSEQK